MTLATGVAEILAITGGHLDVSISGHICVLSNGCVWMIFYRIFFLSFFLFLFLLSQ
jgi:hypothetical protein